MHAEARTDDGKTLLIAEDDPVTRTAVQIVLNNDYALVEASHSDEMLRVCTGPNPPDLIILDLNLATYKGSRKKSLSGLEAIKRLTRFIPFIVLTTDRSRETLIASIGAGAWGYCVKPPSPENLIPAITLALTRADQENNYRRQFDLHRAVGIVMATHRLDEEKALDVIRGAASTERRKVQEITCDIFDAQQCCNYLYHLNKSMNR